MSDEHQQSRRAADKVQDDIDALIAAENDPKERAVLIVLQSINRSLIANTLSTQATHLDLLKHRSEFNDHLDNFKAHAMNEEAIMNKGKGAWWVLAGALSIAQGFAVYSWNDARNEMDELKHEARTLSITSEKNKLRLDHLEKSK